MKITSNYNIIAYTYRYTFYFPEKKLIMSFRNLIFLRYLLIILGTQNKISKVFDMTMLNIPIKLFKKPIAFNKMYTEIFYFVITFVYELKRFNA